jgi:hypothetical protein
MFHAKISQIIGLGSFSALVALTALPAQAGTTICHYPPGNPENVQRITVGDPAVAAHVENHGDTVCGEGNDTCCPGSCTNLANDLNNCGGCGTVCATGEACIEGVCTAATCGPIEDSCFGQVVCGDGCGTVPVVEGGCFCHQGSSCGDVPPCSATSDCPEGSVCAASCCEDLRCLPACANSGGLNAARAAGGARSTP